ncbi:MAG TPA: YdeI/OmpD-associated family protein [Chitinophagaceae bacterium]|nr:YdeI/OmpD-associated family protein [Chitinophagaceae bacterium]
MIQFTTTILQFGQQGEKTGWHYIEIPVDLAQKLKPGNKKTFRVQGKLDGYPFKGVALLPMGGGSFIMALNKNMRKGIHKRRGAMLTVRLEVDTKPYELSPEFVECLTDEPVAYDFFKSLPKGHQNYFSKWIESAKTEATKAKRIAQAVNALARKQGFPQMLRSLKQASDGR